MEGVQKIIDVLKSATYESIALLLPGLVLVAVAHAIAGTPAPESVLVWMIAAYAIGLVLQGVSGWAARHRGSRWLVGAVTNAPTSAQKRASEILTKEFGKELAEEHLLDVVLTRVSNREVYDRFLALTDTARSLALVAVISFGIIVYVHSGDLDVRTTWFALAGVLVAWLGFRERHHRFSPLACKALYGKFIALQGRAPVIDAHESTGTHESE